MRKYEFCVSENHFEEDEDCYLIQVFPLDVDADDYDSIGIHSKDIPNVLNPLGIFAEDMECMFSYYPNGARFIRQPYKQGLSMKEVTEYLESFGWVENKDFDTGEDY